MIPRWALGLRLAAEAGDWRSARCILDNQRAYNPKIGWRTYVTAEQAETIEKTHIPIQIQTYPSHPIPKPKATTKRRKAG